MVNRDSKPKLITPSAEQTPPVKQATIDVSDGAPPLARQVQVAGLDGSSVGGGSRHWMIMAVLGLLIIGGIVLLSMMSDDQEGETAAAENVVARGGGKPEKRDSVPTGERPFKKEMANVSVTKDDELIANLGKWVFLKGKVSSSDADGLIVFEKVPGQKTSFEAQLVRGSAPEIEGKEITVIGWMIDKRHLQIDGPEDVDIELPVADVEPEYELISVREFDLLKERVHQKIVLEGKVNEVRYSHDQENVYLVFDAGKNDVVASGVISMFETGMDFEAMKKYEGKMVKVRGVLGEKSWGDNYRIFIKYSRFRHIEIVE